MPFTTNLTGTAQLDDSIVQAYDAAFIVAYGQNDVTTSLAQYRADPGAKSIEFPRYSLLSLATTPLDEVEDVISEAVADTKVIFTPVEYGKAVTTTALANLQTGGRADVAAARLVGVNLGQTLNKLATIAMEATTNTLIIGGVTEDLLTDANIMSSAAINGVYNKLARANVPFHSGSSYVAVAHDDVLHDIRAGAAAGEWLDVNKYADPSTVLANEVGMYRGFRWIRNNHASQVDQSGAGTVDVYNTCFMGFNALGAAISKTPTLTITGPFDKLGRFVNLGWHGVLEFKIVEPTAIWKLRSASSVGANT